MLEINEPDSVNPETLLDPRLVIINRHRGYPKIIDCSPFHRNIFLSGTTSGELCVQNLLQVSHDRNQGFIIFLSVTISDVF
jgi:hypothetical protein